MNIIEYVRAILEHEIMKIFRKTSAKENIFYILNADWPDIPQDLINLMLERVKL